MILLLETVESRGQVTAERRYTPSLRHDARSRIPIHVPSLATDTIREVTTTTPTVRVRLLVLPADLHPIHRQTHLSCVGGAQPRV
jgi:hypothetical protein